jgi:general secretion pathway protein D
MIVTYRLPAILVGLTLSACSIDDGPSLDPLVSNGQDGGYAAPANGPVLSPGPANEQKPAPLISKGNVQYDAPPSAAATLPAAPKSPEDELYDFSGMEPGDTTSDVDGLTLNFVDMDIKEIAKSILGDHLRLNYTIDPNLSTRLTLRTSEPLASDSVLVAFEQALAANGIALVRQGDVFNVQAAEGVKNAPLANNARLPGFATEIVQLHHVAPGEIAKILTEYGGTARISIADETRGLILITGSAPDRQQLEALIGAFDVDELSGMSFGLFPVGAASPRILIGELNAILKSDGLGSGGILKFIPIDRLQSILAIASDSSDIDQVQLWLTRLDRGISTTEPQLYVHYVEHGEAKQVARTLSAVFGITTDDNDSTYDNNGEVAPGYRPTLIGAKDAPGTTATGDVAAYAATPVKAEYGNDSNGAPDTGFGMGEGYPSDGPESYGGKHGTPTLRITADEQNNALFILATPKDYRLVEAALERIDIAPLQVLIEATIAEVSLTDDLKYGVEYFFKNNQNAFALVNNTLGVPTPVFPGFAAIFSVNDVNVVVTALEKVTNVKVISAPQLTVMDNRTARLQVGDQVPVVKQTAVSVNDPEAPIVNSVELLDTGVILSVTPHVNSSGEVQLEIEQEVSDVVATTTSTIDSPTIQQRRVKSAVAVDDGKTIALGGLIRDRGTVGTSGLPLLSKIPVLGALFGATSDTATRTELLVLITPHVIRDSRDADRITAELKGALKGLNSFRQKKMIAVPPEESE